MPLIHRCQNQLLKRSPPNNRSKEVCACRKERHANESHYVFSEIEYK